MKVTVIGHAGLLIETNGKSILCDPWMSQTGAFLCSWHQWPRNDRLSRSLLQEIESADYLYVSHLHRDHFDEEFLRAYFQRNPQVQVLVPMFNEPNILARELKKLGAIELIMMPDREPIQFDGFTIEALIDWNGTYANKGDSGICITDKDAVVLNQNDSKLTQYPSGIDVHFTQFSGAIWYPMAYKKSIPYEEYATIIASEIERRQIGFMHTVHLSQAQHIFPHAGPPVFLRESQRWMNESGQSVFYDQPELLTYIRQRGVNNAHAVFPEMTVEIIEHHVSITYPNNMTEDDVIAYYSPEHKLKEIESYATDRREIIEAFDNGLPGPTDDVAERMIEWLTPVLEAKSELLDKIGCDILIESDDGQVRVLVDHLARVPRLLTEADNYEHSFTIPRRILEKIVNDRQRVWTSEVFLGVVHTSWRSGAYNRFIYDMLAQMAVPPPKT